MLITTEIDLIPDVASSGILLSLTVLLRHKDTKLKRSVVIHFTGKFDDFAVIEAFSPDNVAYFLTIWLNSGRGECFKASS